ncbi:hypothetical protein N431DRAFT_528908 [Stipitochalara longipes BDJ]|nr:hypothetical protein N431DRAFT_528908 [Stipitochalara longipes BDJ]
MHRTSTIQVAGRDPMREYQKQKEKLQLIKHECIIEWTNRSNVVSKAKLSRLSDELDNIHRYLQALEDEKQTILGNLGQENAWTKPETQRQTLQLLDINSKIRDGEAAVERVGEKALAAIHEIEELESNEIELKRELQEARHNWESRWPEQEECCMILKLELSRAQAELNATYQQIQANFAEMGTSKANNTLIEVDTCPNFQDQMDTRKAQKINKQLSTKVIGDLIAFEDEQLKEGGLRLIVAEDEYAIDMTDLLTGGQGEEITKGGVIFDRDHLDSLVDLGSEFSEEKQGKNEKPEMARTSDDLAVLVTNFPIRSSNSGNINFPVEAPVFRDSADIVQALSKGYSQLINKRFESSNHDLGNMETEIQRFSNQLKLMQPLYDIGLAIRKRQVEVGSGKPGTEKDCLVIAKGNSAAHHAQVLADATWMMASPFNQRFKELYNGVPAEKVWEHREFTVLLDILNWRLDMSLFAPTGGIDKKTFDKLFNIVFPRIYPSFKTSEKDFELDKNLRDALAGMKAEHNKAYERDVQTRKMNRCFLKVQRRVNRQTQTS